MAASRSDHMAEPEINSSNHGATVNEQTGGGDGPTIFLVPDFLRRADPDSYEPRIVALGPYHHNKPHLKATEQLKVHCRNRLFHGHSFTLDISTRIKEKVPQIRAAYSERVDMDDDALANMLLLDACFVLEVIRSLAQGQEVFQGVRNTIANNLRSPTVLARDMLLLENQLPFFLLEDLFDSFFSAGSDDRRLRDWALQFVSKFSGVTTAVVGSDGGNCRHILHLFHSRITSARQTNTAGSARYDQSNVNIPNSTSSMKEEEEPGDLPLRWIPSASEMKAAGVQLRKKNNASNFLDVTFDNGKMEIPLQELDDDTNVLLRNLIAFEQCSPYVDTDVTAYAFLFTCIIATVEDVALLKRRDIIASGLGGNEQVADLFNKLCKEVALDHDKCYLSQVFRDVKKHCKRRPNHWYADLKKNHFNTPWSFIAFIAALIFFMITIAQLVIAILNFLNLRRHH